MRYSYSHSVDICVIQLLLLQFSCYINYPVDLDFSDSEISDHKEFSFLQDTTLISKIINNIFGHRGLLHYSVFWLILGILIAKYNHFTQGLFFGVSGHLFLDACTYKGIPGLGWFLDKKKSFYIFPKKWKMYVGKPRTNVVSGILTIGVTLILAYMSFRTK